MTVVGELVLVLGLLVSGHCEVRARDPEVEEEEELGGRGGWEGVMETPLTDSSVRSGNHCAFEHTRVLMVPVYSGTKTHVVKDQRLCSDGSPSCQQIMYRLSTRPIYRMRPDVVTSLIWRCCPGHTGPHCEKEVSDHQLDSGGSEPGIAKVQLPDISVGLQQQEADLHREQNDHHMFFDPLYDTANPVNHQNSSHPQLEPETSHSHQEQEHQTHRKQAPAEDQVAPPYPNTPVGLPASDVTALVMSQLQPMLEGFNRSLEHLSRQVGILTQDVAELKGIQLEAEQRGGLEEDKLDQVFVQMERIQRQVEDQHSSTENTLSSQHAALHYNLSSFEVEVDTKLKQQQKLLQVSLQAINTTLAQLKQNQDQFSDQKPINQLPPHPPSDTAALWGAIMRLDNTVVNNTVKVGGLMEDMEVTSGVIEELTRNLKVLEKQINQTARNSQVLFMETGLEVEQAKVSVQQQVEGLAQNVTQHERRLQDLDDDVSYLYVAHYRSNSSVDCESLKATIAHLQRGVDRVTELANSNRLTLEENSDGGGAQWGGASDWEPAMEALQHGLQKVEESVVSEQNRTRSLDLGLTQLGSSVAALQETDKQQEAQVKLLSASFRSLLEDAFRHNKVLQLLLEEEVMEFLEWPLRDQEAYSILALKSQLRELQEKLKSPEEAPDGWTGGREEAPSADQPSSSSLPDWLPDGMRRTSGGGQSVHNQLLLLHAGDGSDLWKLEKKVEELQHRVVQLEEKPCSCNVTLADQEVTLSGVADQLRLLKRGLEEHVRVFKNVFSNADVLAESEETLELDKLWELMNRRGKKRGEKGGGKSRTRREESDAVVPSDQSDLSLLFVGQPLWSIANGIIMFRTSLNQGQIYSDTGVFTAPADGIYLCTLTLDLRPGPAHVILRWDKKGGASLSLLHEGVIEAGPVSSVGHLLLREGEEVRLEVRKGDWEESKDNVFMVMLLHWIT
ncbi:multimerin-2 [Nothobranchius furzeri]|uniref:EMI domain-containing protein n=6 Tax=Nothobranchius TaxID=28779 RepID=A0A8C6VUF1_NOTFU